MATWYGYEVQDESGYDLGAYLSEADRDRALARDTSGRSGIAVEVFTVDADDREEALNAIRVGNVVKEGYDEGPEYVVDLYIPFSMVTPPGVAQSEDEAANTARATFEAEGLYEKMLAVCEGTVFGRSDSEWRTEVGEG